MPFTRPTLSAIKARVQGEVDARLPGADSRLRRSTLEVLSTVLAGAAHGLYGYLAWLARQLFPDSAEAEHLARWAEIWGVARKAAIFAQGSADLTGTDGAVLPAGALLQDGAGTNYATDAQVTIVAGTAQAQITAQQAGAAGNNVAGVALTLVSPPAGFDSAATVATGGLTGGLDTESDDSLRARLLDRIRRPPAGGAAFDYEKWALSVAGVTRVFVSPSEQGLGTVIVRFAVDDDPLGPIPDAAKVAEVLAAIDPLRPVTAIVTVLAPVPVALDVTVTLTPNTAAVQAAVTAELTDLLRRVAAPGATILLSQIREAISIAAGETDHVVTVPVADVTHLAGEMAVLGTITFN